MKLLFTVEHTGTHSYLEELGQCAQVHCGQEVDFNKYSEVISLYRDPYRVGASWANRYFEPLDDYKFNLWCVQWKAWAETDSVLVATETLGYQLNTVYDEFGLHKALDENNMEHYHKYVPKRFIEFAQECVDKRGIN